MRNSKVSETMVHLTDHNDFMLIEGDEYLSSPIDLRPKFLWYKPNVTLISGIAWDHINVFPTLESYEDQFRQYIETIVPGGALVYNQDDAVINDWLHHRKTPYSQTRLSNPHPALLKGDGIHLV